MAAIKPVEDSGQRVVCDVPACLETRRAQGQANGRFLFSVTFEQGSVAITTVCPECKRIHTVTFPIPNGACAA